MIPLSFAALFSQCLPAAYALPQDAVKKRLILSLIFQRSATLFYTYKAYDSTIFDPIFTRPARWPQGEESKRIIPSCPRPAQPWPQRKMASGKKPFAGVKTPPPRKKAPFSPGREGALLWGWPFIRPELEAADEENALWSSASL